MNVIRTIVNAYPLSLREAAVLIQTAPARYKVHQIEKRHGRGTRTIAQPTAEIKLLQKLLVREVIEKLPVNDAAKAYRSGQSIADHARPHASNRFLLKLDFKDFFPSIRGADFLKHLHKHSEIGTEDSKHLVKLFFWRPRGTRSLVLSIGAPSSPAISNTIMFDFDSALSDFCTREHVVYTRYADDLAFSTNGPEVLHRVHEHVINLCRTLKYPRLTLNDAKTVYTSKKHHRSLTGLVLSNDGKASLGREKKRQLRAMVHRLKYDLLNQEERAKLKGWIAFALSIDEEFVRSLKRIMGDQTFESLMRG